MSQLTREGRGHVSLRQVSSAHTRAKLEGYASRVASELARAYIALFHIALRNKGDCQHSRPALISR